MPFWFTHLTRNQGSRALIDQNFNQTCLFSLKGWSIKLSVAVNPKPLYHKQSACLVNQLELKGKGEKAHQRESYWKWQRENHLRVFLTSCSLFICLTVSRLTSVTWQGEKWRRKKHVLHENTSYWSLLGWCGHRQTRAFLRPPFLFIGVLDWNKAGEELEQRAINPSSNTACRSSVFMDLTMTALINNRERQEKARENNLASLTPKIANQSD